MIFNELICISIAFISFLFMCLAMYKICDTKTMINNSFIVSLMFILVLFLFDYSFSMVDNGLLRGFVALITYFFVCQFVFKGTFNNAFISAFFEYLLLIVSEIFITIVLVLVLGEDVIEENNFELFKTVVSLFVSILPLIFIKIKIVKKMKEKLLHLSDKYKIIKYFLISLFILVELYVIRYVFITQVGKSLVVSLLMIAILLIYFSFIMYNFYNKQYILEKNRYLTDMNLNYLEIINKDKIYRHNIKNQFLAIKSISSKKVNNMVDNIMAEYKSDNGKIDDISKIPHGLQGIIYQKIIESKKYNLNISVDNFLKDDSKINNSPRLLSSISDIIGILIDNSIESVKELEDPFIHIYINENQESYIFKVSNNFSDSFQLDKIGNFGETTKPKNTGIGLSYLINNKELDTKIKVRENIFIVEVKIKK